ncbi:hypothetical protein D3C78_1696580 [compost metagenome]
MAKQQACVLDVFDFGCGFRADVPELELADAPGQQGVTRFLGGLNCFHSRVVPPVPQHCGCHPFACVGQDQIRRTVPLILSQDAADQGP